MTSPHVPGCRRGGWLLIQLATRKRSAVWRDAFLQRGPLCTCPLSEEARATVQR